MNRPLLSVIIVTYNSREHLERCLPTLVCTEASHEIVVVDNGSQDGTLAWLAQGYPGVRVLESGFNAGYAEGNNIGAAAARGDYLLILNPDTRVTPGAVDGLLAVCMQRPGTVVTPKLLRPDGTINACGTSMHFSGIASCNGLGHGAEAYGGTFSTLLVSGAAFLLERAAWDDVGGFDPAFFMYMEDVDISIRFWLRGYSVLCAAEAVVYHDYHLKLDARKFYFLERNRLVMLAKLYENETLRRLWPGLLMAEIATLAYAIQKGPGFLWARIKGYGWLFGHAKKLMMARQATRSSRVISDQSLLALMKPHLPYQDLTTPQMANLLSLLTTPIFRTVHRSAVHM